MSFTVILYLSEVRKDFIVPTVAVCKRKRLKTAADKGWMNDLPIRVEELIQPPAQEYGSGMRYGRIPCKDCSTATQPLAYSGGLFLIYPDSRLV